MEIKIGCDPELFVKRDGKLVSAYGLIPGTKSNPYYVEDGAVQVDGMALEFNIDPVTTSDDFVNKIESVMSQMRAMIPDDYEFDISPVANFGREYIEQQPPEAKELGCSPDYNAYTRDVNPKPDGSVDFRTASGHIHIGWTEDEDPLHPEHFEACCMLAKQLDYTIGTSQILWDDDRIRHKLYGDYGAFRPKPYGMEYRTPSNAWLRDKSTQKLVADLALGATKMLLGHFPLYKERAPWRRRENKGPTCLASTGMQASYDLLQSLIFKHDNKSYLVQSKYGLEIQSTGLDGPVPEGMSGTFSSVWLGDNF